MRRRREARHVVTGIASELGVLGKYALVPDPDALRVTRKAPELSIGSARAGYL